MAKSSLSVLINTREFDMNMLMTIAVIGASVIGEFAEAAVVVFLFSLGNALQGYTLDKTRSSIRELMEITPVQALVRRGTEEVILPVEEIFIGDVIIVRPGERIAMDGRVCAGYSTVNQAPITGESIPVEKKPGDTIFAGTINGHGSLEIEVIRKAEDNTISRIIHGGGGSSAAGAITAFYRQVCQTLYPGGYIGCGSGGDGAAPGSGTAFRQVVLSGHGPFAGGVSLRLGAVNTGFHCIGYWQRSQERGPV